MSQRNVEQHRIAVVVLCWNDASEVHLAMDKLCSGLPSDTVIWIVDNASQIPFAHNGKNYVSLNVIRSEKNRGFAGGNNLAIIDILKEDFTYILLLNSDIQYSENLIGKLISYIDSHSDIDIVGPVIREGNERYYGGRDPAKFLNTRLTEKRAPDYVPGTFFLCRSSVFNQIGLLDEDFFFSGEIADFCKRATFQKFKLAIDYNSEIEHDVDSKTDQREGLYFYYNLRNRFLFLRKHHRKDRVSLATTWIMRGARILAGSLIEGNWTKIRATCWALFDGIMGNYGDRNDRFR